MKAADTHSWAIREAMSAMLARRSTAICRFRSDCHALSPTGTKAITDMAIRIVVMDVSEKKKLAMSMLKSPETRKISSFCHEKESICFYIIRMLSIRLIVT